MTTDEELRRLYLLAHALRRAGCDVYLMDLRTVAEPIPCLYMDDCRIYPGQAAPDVREHVDWLPDYTVFHRDRRLGAYGNPREAVKAAVLALIEADVDAALAEEWQELLRDAQVSEP